MGLAKATDLNSSPGPRHVLEYAEALNLSTNQRGAASALMQTHKSNATLTSTQLSAAAQVLDRTCQIDEALLATLTADAG